MLPLPPYTDLFTPKVLDRAEDYGHEDAISLINLGDDNIIAEVYGTRNYNVHISWHEDDYINMQCNCPYALEYDHCKHLAAVLMYVESFDGTESSPPVLEHPPDVAWLLQKSKKKDLIRFLEIAMQENSLLKEKFILFSKHSKTPDDYHHRIKNFLKRFTDRYGYLNWHDLPKITSHLEDMIYTLDQANKIDDLIAACPEIIVQVNDVLSNTDDSYGYLGDTITVAFETLANLVTDDHLSPVQKTRLNGFLFSALEHDSLFEWDCGRDIWYLLSETIETTDQYERLAVHMDQFLAGKDNWSKGYYSEIATQVKTMILDRLGEREAVITLLLENLHLKKIREMVVDECTRHGLFDDAINLILEGIEIAKEEAPGHVVNWQERLFEIGELTRDTDLILRQAKYLFTANRYQLKYYQLIKKYTPPELWPEEREAIFSSIHSDFYNKSSIFKLYQYEGMWDRLLQAIAGYGSDFYILDEYADDLLAYDRKATIQLYIDRIIQFAQRSNKRKHYKVIAQYLRSLKKMGFQTEVAELADQLRMTYKRRPAMLQELAGI